MPDSDISACFDEKADDANVFFSRPRDCDNVNPDPESLAQTLEKSLGLHDQTDNADVLSEELKDKLVIAKPRPRISDCIATDDEDWKPLAWHAWDEWEQKVNVQASALDLG